MLDYTKEELISLIENNPEKFNEWKKEVEENSKKIENNVC